MYINVLMPTMFPLLGPESPLMMHILVFAKKIFRLWDYIGDLSWVFSWHSQPKRSLSQGKLCPVFSYINGCRKGLQRSSNG